MARSHWSIDGAIVILDQVVDDFTVVLETHRRRDPFEQLMEFVGTRVEHLDFVRDTAEERAVNKVSRFQIG